MLARCDTVLNFPPATLMNGRYLGLQGEDQRDFNQLERFRIDNVHENDETEIHFETKEDHTQVRIAALGHAQLEFAIDLFEKKDNTHLDQAKNSPESPK